MPATRHSFSFSLILFIAQTLLPQNRAGRTSGVADNESPAALPLELLTLCVACVAADPQRRFSRDALDTRMDPAERVPCDKDEPHIVSFSGSCTVFLVKGSELDCARGVLELGPRDRKDT